MRRIMDPPGMSPETGQHTFVVPDSLAIGTSTKSGSTSVHAWMEKYHHDTYRRRYPKYFRWGDYETSLAIIRDPYERIRSFYNDYIEGTNTGLGTTLLEKMGFTLDMTFHQFLETLAEARKKEIPFPRLMVPQYYFLLDADHSLPATLIRCINLSSQWPFPDKPIGHTNKSKIYTEHDWKAEEREIVESVFQLDFELIGLYL